MARKSTSKSLPWFEFSPKAFLSDTQRLNTEAKGAYLLLILDYYEQRIGPPDDDEVLATITGLPIERWQRYRNLIAAKFELRDGRWWHAYCEDIIRDSACRYTRTVAAREAQAARAAERAAAKSAVATPVTEHVTAPVTGRAAVTAPVEDPPQPVLQRYNNKDSNRYYPSYEGDAPLRGGLGVGVIPEDFALSPAETIRCQSEGYSSDQIGSVLRRFKRANLESGAMTDDWNAAWWRFWQRERPALAETEKPKAKPRIEVSRKGSSVKTPLPDDWQPNETNAKTAAEHGYELGAIAQHFRDVCGANGYRYANHHQAFNNFIRNQQNFNRGRSHGKAPTARGGSITDASARLDAELDRAIAEAESREQDGGGAVLLLPEG